MKEALFILLIIVALVGLTAIRYRRQVFMAIRIWRQIRDGGLAIQGDDRLPSEGSNNETLVNCSKCGKWKEEKLAIRLGRSTYFCSSKCLESHSVQG